MIHRTAHDLCLFSCQNRTMAYMCTPISNKAPASHSLQHGRGPCSESHLKDRVEFLRTPERGVETLHVLNRLVEPEGLRRHQRDPRPARATIVLGIDGGCSQRLLNQQGFRACTARQQIPRRVQRGVTTTTTSTDGSAMSAAASPYTVTDSAPES